VRSRDLDELTSLGEIEGEGLVDDDMLSRLERCRREREVAVVRTGNHDQVHIGMCYRFHGRTDSHIGEVRENMVWSAGSDDGELKARNGADERSVKRFADVAIADEGDANRGRERRICHESAFPE
jgi:hypothetical protein